MRSFRVALLLLLLPLASSTSAASAGVVRFHARLVRSVPAANDTLRTSPPDIRLWFSEAVELGVSRIKLIDATGTAHPTGKPARSADGSDKSVAATVDAALAPGRYSVQWTAVAKDGHPMKGTYAFVVRGGGTP